jgi:hypothetical protein
MGAASPGNEFKKYCFLSGKSVYNFHQIKACTHLIDWVILGRSGSSVLQAVFFSSFEERSRI